MVRRTVTTLQTLAGCYLLARNESFMQLIYRTIQATNGYNTSIRNKCRTQMTKKKTDRDRMRN